MTTAKQKKLNCTGFFKKNWWLLSEISPKKTLNGCLSHLGNSMEKCWNMTRKPVLYEENPFVALSV
jgi:hypothetical protein